MNRNLLNRRKFLGMTAGLAAAGPALVRAEADAPFRLVMLSGSLEYKSAETLAEYKNRLEAHGGARVDLLIAKGEKEATIPGVEALKDADVALFFTRRLTLPDEQLQIVKDYCASGRPIVGVRTASHGFQTWLEFDKTYLGGNYGNHHGKGQICRAELTEAGRAHPIMAGVEDFTSPASLYRTSPLAEDCVALMMGTIPDTKPEPLAWARELGKQRIFYTSLGAPEDFKNENFTRMLDQAIGWARGK